MDLTVERLLDFINNYEEITSDFKVYIEYPKRYGLLTIDGVEIEIDKQYDFFDYDYSDMIPAYTIGANFKAKKLYIYHHY